MIPSPASRSAGDPMADAPRSDSGICPACGAPSREYLYCGEHRYQQGTTRQGPAWRFCRACGGLRGRHAPGCVKASDNGPTPDNDRSARPSSTEGGTPRTGPLTPPAPPASASRGNLRSTRKTREDPMTDKTCRRCGQSKPAADFRANDRMRDGLNSWCKACQVERTREWRRDHRDEYNAVRRRGPVELTCVECGEVFPSARADTLTCGYTCRRRRKYRREQEGWASLAELRATAPKSPKPVHKASAVAEGASG